VKPFVAAGEDRRLKPQECHVIDCGHMASYERPREVAEHMASFTTTRAERQDS